MSPLGTDKRVYIAELGEIESQETEEYKADNLSYDFYTAFPLKLIVIIYHELERKGRVIIYYRTVFIA